MNEVFDVNLNPTEWFASAGALAAVVASAVALLRKHVLKRLDGTPVVGLSFALSLALAYGGKLLGLLHDDPLLFGLTAAVLASGGRDFIASIRTKPNSVKEEAPTAPAKGADDDSHHSDVLNREVTDEEVRPSPNSSRARLR